MGSAAPGVARALDMIVARAFDMIVAPVFGLGAVFGLGPVCWFGIRCRDHTVRSRCICRRLAQGRVFHMGWAYLLGDVLCTRFSICGQNVVHFAVE